MKSKKKKKKKKLSIRGVPSQQTDRAALVGDIPRNVGSSQRSIGNHNFFLGTLRLLFAIPIRVARLAFKSVIGFVVFCLIITFVSAYGFFYLKKPSSANIRGELTQIGEMEFSYSMDQIENVSPLCGCIAEHKPETWRGITFAGRHFQVESKGSSSHTSYSIVPGVPNWIGVTQLANCRINGRSNNSCRLIIPALIYTISIPVKHTFDPRFVINPPQQHPSYQIIEAKYFDERSQFALMTDKPLNIALLGDRPLGSWIPMRDSRVSISYEKSMHVATPAIATITESYSGTNPKPEEFLGITENGQSVWGTSPPDLPLGDFLGPQIVLWTEGKASFSTGYEGYSTVESNHPQRKNVSAAVFDPPFSLRLIVETSIAKNDLDSYFDDLKKRMFPDNPVFLGPSEGAGSVRLVILDPESQAKEFGKLYHQLESDRIIKASGVNIEYNVSDQEVRKTKANTEFQVPPIPPNKGFNIFGSPRYIKFLSSVSGKAMIKTRTFDIVPPSALELIDIKHLNIRTVLEKQHADSAGTFPGVLAVPIQLSSPDQSKIQIETRAVGYLNGEPMNRRTNDLLFNSDLSPYISLVMGALAIVIAAVTLFLTKPREA